MKLNENFLKLEGSYLFSKIAKRVSEYQEENTEADIIRLGIGDVTLPLCKSVVNAMQEAAAEQGVKNSFRGYGPEQGYDFLRQRIVSYYGKRSVSLESSEVFISDGAKSDLGNILDIFSADNTVLVPDPVYPVYVDTNIMAGRKLCYMEAKEENNFLPMPSPNTEADIIYLCSPNNPTGAVYSKEQLKKWVEYANQKHAVILFDAAYERFVSEPELPHSIYEIEGAKTCAIEFCSLSKTAGFTGIRCGYTIVPKELVSNGISLASLWLRRQTTKFNGVSYPVQRAAEAVFTEEGQNEIEEAILYYKENAKVIKEGLNQCSISSIGGVNSPYIWLKCPNQISDTAFFEMLLTEANVVGTPGSGFGNQGKGYFRLTAFGDRERTQIAMERIQKLSF